MASTARKAPLREAEKLEKQASKLGDVVTTLRERQSVLQDALSVYWSGNQNGLRLAFAMEAFLDVAGRIHGGAIKVGVSTCSHDPLDELGRV